jgi:hypothetical protein
MQDAEHLQADGSADAAANAQKPSDACVVALSPGAGSGLDAEHFVTPTVTDDELAAVHAGLAAIVTRSRRAARELRWQFGRLGWSQ